MREEAEKDRVVSENMDVSERGEPDDREDEIEDLIRDSNGNEDGSAKVLSCSPGNGGGDSARLGRVYCSAPSCVSVPS